MFSKATSTLALVVVLLAIAAASAAASTLAFEPAGEFTMASEGKVTFSEEEVSGSCNLTYGGTLARGPITIEERATVGSISRVAASECTGMEAVTALSLSWMIGLRVLGTPPTRITGLLLGFTRNIAISFLGIRCLYSGETGLLAALSGGFPYTWGPFRFLGIAIRKVSGSSFCPSRIRIGGTMVFRPSQAISAS